MSEDGKKTLGVIGGPRSGNVKQSFSHGRTKNVVVETKRKRVIVPKPGAAKPVAPGAVRGSDPARRPAGISDTEMDRRLKAVQTAKARETEDNKRREEEERSREAERNLRREATEAKERESRDREERAKIKADAEEARESHDSSSPRRGTANSNRMSWPRWEWGWKLPGFLPLASPAQSRCLVNSRFCRCQKRD